MDDDAGSLEERPSGISAVSGRVPLVRPESHMDVQGYRWVCWRVWLCRFGGLLTLGLIPVLFNWRPRIGVLARCKSCPPALAHILLVRDHFGKQYVVDVLTEAVQEGSIDLTGGEMETNETRDTVRLHNNEKFVLRYYVFEGLRYVWMAKKGAFCRVGILNEDWTCADLYRFKEGLSAIEHSARRKVYGGNLIDVPVKSYLQLLVEEVLNPFYLFQVFSITLWLVDRYYYYATCVLVISVLSIGVSLYVIRKQSVTIRQMAQLITNVTVRRSSGIEECVSSVDLVPGDCLVIPEEGMQMPCDAALLAGECMVNESMLTGESVPVMKTPLPEGGGPFCSEGQRRHTLFCGTQVIQAKGGRAVAVVTSTGFSTAKGDLISSILYPQPINFRFYRDTTKFLLFLAGVALLGTIYSVGVLIRTNMVWWELVIRTLDIVTIVVPPALPAAITTGTIYAQGRLKRQGVFCVSPPRINVCGKISIFCFDKTGTLTEEGLDVWGVMEASEAGFSDLVPDPKLLAPGPMLTALACCHTVALLGEQPLGDPLELKMLESTGWALEEPEGAGVLLSSQFGGHRVLALMSPPASQSHPEGYKYQFSSGAVAIVRRFPFSSSLQRMSVVALGSGAQPAFAFLKGAPEMVASLCCTLPVQFSSTLRGFATEGFRVLALGYKRLDERLDLKTVERQEIEKDMQFLGLLIMKNLVKPESAKVIETLRKAQLRTVMVTGDNIFTSVNVARSCRMMDSEDRVIFVTASPQSGRSQPQLRFHLGEGGDTGSHSSIEGLTQNLYQNGMNYHLAINGKSFAALCDHFPEYLPKVLMRGTVFARMGPEQKSLLVQELQNLNYRVGMCGDGANDCGALRAADVGVSLSEAEASVASPFTSKSDNISCVPLLIREGRCSLVTSFSLIRYMALYSLTQFCSVLILYTVKTNLGDIQFLFCDMGLVTLLAVVMGRGGPHEELHPKRPPGSLLAVPVLGSVFLHTLMVILGQLAALFITMSQDWFVPLNSTVPGAGNLPNLEDTSVFTMSGYQYIIMAVVVTKGYPFKKPLFHNVVFLVILLLLLALMTWIVLYPLPSLRQLLQLYDITDMNFKLLLVALAALNFLTCFILEVLIDNGVLNFLPRCRRKKQSKKQYKRLDVLLLGSPSWPPLNQALSSTQCTVIGVS